MVTDFKFSQFLKTALPIPKSDGGITTDVNPLQPLNAELSIYFTADKLIERSPQQPSKEEIPRRTTEDGRMSSSILWQPEKCIISDIIISIRNCNHFHLVSIKIEPIGRSR